jgi:hypothetical protein
MADIPKTFTDVPANINEAEHHKFEIDPLTGYVQVRTTAKGTFTASGLKTGGKATEVVLNATTWTALPPVSLAGRNSISIQNQDATLAIKINHDNTVVGYVGVIVGPNSERHYDITDSLVIYAKSASGTPTVVIEEIA